MVWIFMSEACIGYLSLEFHLIFIYVMFYLKDRKNWKTANYGAWSCDNGKQQWNKKLYFSTVGWLNHVLILVWHNWESQWTEPWTMNNVPGQV